MLKLKTPRLCRDKQNHNSKLKTGVVNLVKTSLSVSLVVLSLFVGTSAIGQLPQFNHTTQIQAATCPPGYSCYGGCTRDGQCVNNKTCESAEVDVGGVKKKVIRISNRTCGSALLGKVEPPKGVFEYNARAGGSSGINIGILVFASKLLKLANIVAGLLIFANFVSAGYTYITSAGNTSLYAEIKDKLTFSIIGIIIIVAAYSGVAIFSYIFFGDPGLLLNPDLTKYGALAPPGP